MNFKAGKRNSNGIIKKIINKEDWQRIHSQQFKKNKKESLSIWNEEKYESYEIDAYLNRLRFLTVNE